jgi:hypothetical protein
VLWGLRTAPAVDIDDGAVRLAVTLKVAPDGAVLCGIAIVPLMPAAIGIVIEIGAPVIGIVVVSFPDGDVPDAGGSAVGMLDIEPPPPLHAAKLTVRSNKVNEMCRCMRLLQHRPHEKCLNGSDA